jgi:transposase
MNKTKKMQEIETRFGMNLEELLRQKYEIEGKNTYEVAGLIGVSDVTISNWLRGYNIPVRNISEALLKGKKKPSKEQLKQWYKVEGKTTVEIAELVGVGDCTVGVWLNDYKIPKKNFSEAKLKGKQKPSEQQLRQWYETEKKTTTEIAKIVGVGNCTVGHWLNEYKIPVRNNSEAQLRGKQKPSEEQLRQWYIVETKNSYEIGELVNVSTHTVRNWLKDYKIPIRNVSEAILKGKKKPGEQQLRQWYEVERKTTRDIAELVGVGDSAIGRWLHKYKIPTRNQDTTRQLKKEALEKVIERYTA